MCVLNKCSVGLIYVKHTLSLARSLALSLSVMRYHVRELSDTLSAYTPGFATCGISTVPVLVFVT